VGGDAARGGSTGGGYLGRATEYDSALDDYFTHLLYLDYAVSVRRRSRSGARWRQIDGGILVTLTNPSVGCGHFGRECENMLLEGALWKNCENAFTVSGTQITCCIPGPLIWVNGDHYRIDELL
jgi:hypothetical protein